MNLTADCTAFGTSFKNWGGGGRPKAEHILVKNNLLPGFTLETKPNNLELQDTEFGNIFNHKLSRTKLVAGNC